MIENNKIYYLISHDIYLYINGNKMYPIVFGDHNMGYKKLHDFEIVDWLDDGLMVANNDICCFLFKLTGNDLCWVSNDDIVDMIKNVGVIYGKESINSYLKIIGHDK